MPDGHTIWTMKIRSAGATSLNFVFRNTNLPPHSEMYLYAAAEFMVMGPITATHVHEGIYATDVIYGEEVVIAVRMPSSQVGDFVLEVDEAVHGYMGRGSREFGESTACNVDVNCSPFGDDWQPQRDAVAKIISGNIDLCSGALINTACPTFRPLFLTAFHCIEDFNDTPGIGVLSASEISELTNWVFRFNYESSHDPSTYDPALGCRQAEPTSWLTYSGAVLRASWFDTDFALLELNQPIAHQTSLAVAGWSRNFIPGGAAFPNIPGPITSIHHPMGDVKMISLDNDPAIADLNTSMGDLFWFVDTWDTGTTENASSGGPMFDANGRIVGQVQGGDGFDGCEPDKGTFFGRFDQSWTGGGTSDSRLSDILGNAPTNVMTTNTIEMPELRVSGRKVICTDEPQIFELVGPLPGANVSWSATPSEYFVEHSGTGRFAGLQAISNNYGGLGTLTFTITFFNGCLPITYSQIVWVGKPAMPLLETNPVGTPIVQLAVNDLMTATVTEHLGSSPSDITWKSAGSIDFKNSPSGIHALLEATSTGAGEIRVESINECNVPSPSNLVVVMVGENLVEPESGPLFSVSPNPIQNEMTIEALWKEPLLESGTIQLRDITGRVYHNQPSEGQFTNISTELLPEGILFLQVTTSNRSWIEKVIIIK